MANSCEYVFIGMLKMLEEWEDDAVSVIDHMAEEGSTPLECHEEAAQEAGYIRHKIDSVYDMALINMPQYKELMSVYHECLKEVTDYIWDELFAEEAQ